MRVNPNNYAAQSQADTILRAAIGRGDLSDLPEAMSVALDADQRLKKLQDDLRTLPTADIGSLVRATVHRAMTGQPMDAAAFESEQLRAALTKVAHEGDMHMFGLMHQELQAAWLRLVADHAEDLLAATRVRMENHLAVVARVRGELGELDRSDPVAILSASDQQREALLTLPDLAQTYSLLRTAQQAVLATAYPGTPAGQRLTWRAEGELSWADVFSTGAHELEDFDESPTPDIDLDPVERLLAITDRRPWMPTTDQMGDRADDILEAARANHSGAQMSRDRRLAAQVIAQPGARVG